MHFF
jgi:hypothetical protein